MKQLGLRILLLAVASFAGVSQPASGEIIEPDVQVSLTRINPTSGKTIWSVPFDRKLRPYRCEAYTNRIVAYLFEYDSKHGFEPENTKVVFLSSETGDKVSPFDTRNFLHPEEDPLITRTGSDGSMEEERSELSLPNGWRSHGVAGLAWRNSGKNSIYFFQGSQLKWTMILPDGAYNLAHWKDILIYRRHTEDNKRITDTLYAYPAGRDSTTWSFALPNDIPDRRWSDRKSTRLNSSH